MGLIEQQQTAILFFSRNPQEEATTKKFTFRRSQEAIRVLLKHSLRQARKTKLPLFTCYSAQQSGDTFGERLTNALEGVFKNGYDNVLVIGNDSPGLSAGLLHKANRALLTGQLVLGPALDGGVYLIGINRAAYDRHLFLNLLWETPDLQASWQHYISEKNLSVTRLCGLTDIDTAADFWHFFRHYQTGLVARRLSACLQEGTAFSVLLKITTIPLLRIITFPQHRGPPVWD
ncbi:DUF2064 domain-containing protein [Lewinella sp. LCG006]|uniref:TIGR04282 family arsenosugar biosynthesis glycosyltransferase n=1 Tax=Lewinella sp. LCG006 TaxID=3231911 RepID=UPI00346054FB